VEKVAVVSGANRGIGLAVVRGLAEDGVTAVLGSRDPRSGEAAAAPLRAQDLDVRPQQLDVTDQASIDRLARWVEDELGRCDVLVNNAGILRSGRATDMDPRVADEVWKVNALGAWRLAVAVIPLMRRGGGGRIVNVSSGAGSLSQMRAYAPAYSVSKAALNAITRVLAAELREEGILVNAVSPGWVATDMGGTGAPRSLEQGAASVLWAVWIPDEGPTGGFFSDGEPVPW
jgi:NAD(P)-dependent dehydrogenase (short-subunit alcohol dehydrogenase family)